MNNIIIGTHGHLSKEFIETAKLIAGEDIQVDYLCMTKGKSVNQAENEARVLLENRQEKKAIVLTDVLGGSVANMFTSLLEEYDFDLISGVNLPMILTILLTPETESRQEWIHNLIVESRKGIQHVNELLENELEGDDLDDFFNED